MSSLLPVECIDKVDPIREVNCFRFAAFGARGSNWDSNLRAFVDAACVARSVLIKNCANGMRSCFVARAALVFSLPNAMLATILKSKVATNFRKWATERLKEYMIKGFTMDDERLKGYGGGNYWKELLARIKDIRSSEKVLYRQVLDLYATAVDYNPKDSKSIEFFKIVQNKLHYATHGHTASEVIYERADAEKPFMGLTTFKGDIPVLQDVVIAKNYLNEEELKVLNNLVSGYFDFAEIQAIRHNLMYMEDYIKQLDMILSSAGGKVLIGAGSVSHHQAIRKAKSEYKKYQVKTISPVEEE